MENYQISKLMKMNRIRQQKVLLELSQERLRLTRNRTVAWRSQMMYNLEGLRIVVSGFELEQQEHRGIAAFSKVTVIENSRCRDRL